MKEPEYAKTYGLLFDDELDIIEMMQNLLRHSVTLLLNHNNYERHILSILKKKFDFVDSSGHNEPPPDFYSDKHSVMFDVTRVNASEVRKTYNPVIIEEYNMAKKLEQSGLRRARRPDVKVTCTPLPPDIDTYTYEKYSRNVERVIRQHINKIPLWQTEHPNVREKGLIILDESEFCFEGILQLQGDTCLFLWEHNRIPVAHEPWNDKEFMEPCYNSLLDFVVWVCPYKPYGDIPRMLNMRFPAVVIIDVRHQRRKPYINYNTDKLVMC